MQVRVSRWGNSLAVRLPKAIADDLRLEEGQAVDLEIENGSVRMRPVARRKYPTLAEMVAEMERLLRRRGSRCNARCGYDPGPAHGSSIA